MTAPEPEQREAAPDPASRLYWAHRRVRGEQVTYLHATVRRSWLSLFGSPEPVVAVRLRERDPADPPSPYWGWVEARKPDRYTMVWPSEMLLEVCFPYGTRAPESQGYGRRVNLIVEEIPPPEAVAE